MKLHFLETVRRETDPRTVWTFEAGKVIEVEDPALALEFIGQGAAERLDADEEGDTLTPTDTAALKRMADQAHAAEVIAEAEAEGEGGAIDDDPHGLAEMNREELAGLATDAGIETTVEVESGGRKRTRQRRLDDIRADLAAYLDRDGEAA